jgi:hypothetical protein
MRSLQPFTLGLTAALGTLAGGCMLTPLNGDAIAGQTASISLGGFYPAANATLHLQIFAPDQQQWLPVADATSASQATATNGNISWYPWQLTAAPATAPNYNFTPGGLVHLRTINDDATQPATLTTFDQDFSRCLQANSTQTWEQIGTRCHSINAGIATLVSEDPSPDVAANPSPPNYLAAKSTITQEETKNYYQQFQLPHTLDEFKQRYGFNDYPLAVDNAVYYNDGDLGIGRDMNCVSFFAHAPDPVGPGEACYVTNHGVKRDASGQPILDDHGRLQGDFGGNLASALTDAQQHVDGFATVAMVYLAGSTDGNNSTRFVVYDQLGNLATQARLDTRGQNTSIPNNCLVCHGGSSYYNVATHGLAGKPAHFLPFDTDQLLCDVNGGRCTGTSQGDVFGRLNNHVTKANPTGAIADLINGWYGGTPGGGRPFNGNYIPGGWGGAINNATPSAAGRLYDNVYKPFCRTCHISNEDGATAFASSTDFTNNAGVPLYTCEFTNGTAPLVMPQAEHTQRRFWHSPARAYLAGAFSYRGACKPSSAPIPWP